MSKKVKSLIERETASRLKGVDAVAVINPRGINAIKNNLIRRRLHEKGLRMMVVKNTLARRATEGTPLNGFEKLLDGPSAVIYGKESLPTIARAVLDEKKADDTLELRGVYFAGEIYPGAKGVEQVSKLPTREEAIGQILSAILGPGARLAGALKGPGGKLGGILKTIQDKAKEAGGADAAPAA